LVLKQIALQAFWGFWFICLPVQFLRTIQSAKRKRTQKIQLIKISVSLFFLNGLCNNLKENAQNVGILIEFRLWDIFCTLEAICPWVEAVQVELKALGVTVFSSFFFSFSGQLSRLSGLIMTLPMPLEMARLLRR